MGGALDRARRAGQMTRVEYEAFVADLVNYLDYMAEPARNQRIHVGMFALLFLGVLFALAYWTEARLLERRSLTGSQRLTSIPGQEPCEAPALRIPVDGFASRLAAPIYGRSAGESTS
jgi:hypothetical protein